MSNMSYCRFQNTLSDLEDCEMSLEEIFCDDESEGLSEEEARAALKLIEVCGRIWTQCGEVTKKELTK